MQQSIEIVVIVPKLPPCIDGIGDYGLNLARQLYQDFRWKTHFLVGDPSWQGDEQGDFFRVTPLAARSSSELQKRLPAPPATVLLHYAGHGYARRGCPVWLVKALRQWCRAGGSLITMFHELYATKPLLSSALLTSPLQKQLAIQLMEFSDRALTSRKQYADKIQHLSRGKHAAIPAFPVFSPVSEIINPVPLVSRARQAIVFGGAAARLRVYQRSRSALIKICRELEIQEIIDIGANLNFEIEPIAGVELRHLGKQPAHVISQSLSRAIVGFLDYSTSYLGKSSIFAAYCSHGVIPVTGSPDAFNEDGLRANQHYWLANTQHALDLDVGQAIATTAHQWYQHHCLTIQSRVFAEKIMTVAKAEITV